MDSNCQSDEHVMHLWNYKHLFVVLCTKSDSISAVDIPDEWSILFTRWCHNSIVVHADCVVGLLRSLSQICFKMDSVKVLLCLMDVSCCMNIVSMHHMFQKLQCINTMMNCFIPSCRGRCISPTPPTAGRIGRYRGVTRGLHCIYAPGPGGRGHCKVVYIRTCRLHEWSSVTVFLHRQSSVTMTCKYDAVPTPGMLWL